MHGNIIREGKRAGIKHTFPIYLVIRVTSFSHCNAIFQSIKANRFFWILPAQVHAPSDFVRVILQTSMWDAVIKQQHASKGHLASHHIFLHAHPKAFLHFFFLHFHVPCATCTASVSGSESRFVATRYYLKASEYEHATQMLDFSYTFYHYATINHRGELTCMHPFVLLASISGIQAVGMSVYRADRSKYALSWCHGTVVCSL